MPGLYEQPGGHYGTHRRADPRWAARIAAALGEARTVVNVGAGAGSYEPQIEGDDRRLVAIEPAAAMIAQRPAGAAPAVRAVAEALPLRDGVADAAMAILTVHHWRNPAAGFAELRRVARRQVVVTWDPALSGAYWLVADYVPELAERESGLATLDAVTRHLRVVDVQPLLVPSDCTDGFMAAYWARPEAYLDAPVRAAISGLALLDQRVVADAMRRLADDLATGRWDAAHPGLRTRDALDAGYRLVVAEG